MSRTKGAKDKHPRLRSVAVTPVQKEEPIKESKQVDWTDLEWRVAEELHLYCGIPGCTTKVHLLQARSIIKTVNS